MLTIGSISVAFANTAADPNSIYIIIGVVILVFLLLASAETSGTRRQKTLCSYCGRRIDYSIPPNTPHRLHPAPPHAQGNNRLLANRPSQMYPPSHNGVGNVPIPPVQRRGGNIYCPYCQGKL